MLCDNLSLGFHSALYVLLERSSALYKGHTLRQVTFACSSLSLVSLFLSARSLVLLSAHVSLLVSRLALSLVSSRLFSSRLVSSRFVSSRPRPLLMPHSSYLASPAVEPESVQPPPAAVLSTRGFRRCLTPRCTASTPSIGSLLRPKPRLSCLQSLPATSPARLLCASCSQACLVATTS